MAYRASITLEVDIATSDAGTANRIALSIGTTLPQGCRLMEPPEIELRVLRPVDKQMISHLPDLTRERMHTLLEKMTEDQRLILALCTKPRYSHVVYTALRHAFPTLQSYTIATHIAELRTNGWLETVT